MKNITTTVVISLFAILGSYQAPTYALNITQNNNPNTLLSNLLGDTSGLSNFEIELIGDGRAFGTFENDPFNLASGVILSTGRVTDLVGTNEQDGLNFFGSDLNKDFGEPGTSGDSISLIIEFDADASKDFFYFQYIFGSEEFVEFGGSQFNDKFSLNLNGFNFAKLSDGKEVTINNLVPNSNGAFHPDFVNNPVGTGAASNETRLDGYTQRIIEDLALPQPLLFQAPLAKNSRNILEINVQDVGDRLYDTAVFIRGETVGTAEPSPVTETDGNGDPNGTKIPEPNTCLGILSFAFLSLTAIFKKHRKNHKIA